MLGTKQENDLLIYESPDNPTWMFGAEVSDDGRYVLIDITESCEPVNKLYILDTQGKAIQDMGSLHFGKIVDNFDAEYEYITNEGTLFFFKTNLNASRYRIVTYDLSDPSKVRSRSAFIRDT